MTLGRGLVLLAVMVAGSVLSSTLGGLAGLIGWAIGSITIGGAVTLLYGDAIHELVVARKHLTLGLDQYDRACKTLEGQLQVAYMENYILMQALKNEVDEDA